MKIFDISVEEEYSCYCSDACGLCHYSCKQASEHRKRLSFI